MSEPRCCGSHEGDTVRSHRVDGLARFFASTHGSGRIPPHFHDRLRICLVVEGAYEERLPGERVECRPGTLLAHAPGLVHENQVRDSGAFCFQIAYEPGSLEGLQELEGAGSPVVAVRPPLATMLDLWDALRFSESEDELTLEEGARVLITQLSTATAMQFGNTTFPWLGRVLERLRDDSRKTPTLRELAAVAGVSRSHLAASFKARFGCTIGEYLRQLRTRRAAEQLTRAEPSLAEVAYAAGFADQSHMNRTFKRQVGLTPGAFRKRFLNA